ncbi:MAG: hypothetical protein QM504_03450 [Pseudomonadota bacterium]
MLNEKHFTNYMVIAPIEQLGYKMRDIKRLLSYRYKEIKEIINPETKNVKIEESFKYAVADRNIRNVSEDNSILNCTFCDRRANIVLTFPVFDISEEYRFIKVVNLKHACNLCEIIVKLNPSSENSVIKRIAEIIRGFDHAYTHGILPKDMIEQAKQKRRLYSENDWDWDFTYLERRGFANTRMFSSTAGELKKISSGPSAVWASVANTDEYLKLKEKDFKPKVVVH